MNLMNQLLTVGLKTHIDSTLQGKPIFSILNLLTLLILSYSGVESDRKAWKRYFH